MTCLTSDLVISLLRLTLFTFNLFLPLFSSKTNFSNLSGLVFDNKGWSSELRVSFRLKPSLLVSKLYKVRLPSYSIEILSKVLVLIVILLPLVWLIAWRDIWVSPNSKAWTLIPEQVLISKAQITKRCLVLNMLFSIAN